MEEWRAISGTYGVYEVSDLGRVRHAYTGLLRKAHANKRNGYSYISLRFGARGDSTVFNRTVHSLVADAFLGQRPHEHEVDHVSGNKSDNRACNLEYVTKAENTRRNYALTGRRPPKNTNVGAQCHQAKLTDTDVRTIRQTPGLLREVAAQYGVSIGTISLIRLRQTWKHVT